MKEDFFFFFFFFHGQVESSLLTYPVMHLQLGGCCQPDGPPLFGPLRSVDGKRVFGVTAEHRNQDGDLIDESMKVLWEGKVTGEGETEKE